MAKWGMTEPEVLKAFGSAARTQTEKVANRQSSDETSTVGIDDVAVGGVSFRAFFVFDSGGGLETIRLEPPASSSQPLLQFRSVEDYLVGKYGKPIRGTSATDVVSVWILQRSVIELDCVETTTLTLTFGKRDGQTKESLLSGLVEIQGRHSLPSGAAASISAVKAPAPVQPVSEARPGKWRVSKSKSQFDDSPTVVLALRAENSIRGWLTTSIPVLFIRCQERRTEVYVATGMQASVESGGSNLHTVRLRYGDDAAYATPMSESTDNKSLFFIDPTNDIRRMWNVQSLLVGFTPFNANPVTIRFDVSGLPIAIQPLREACGW
jgi:hypothetical protein